MTKPYSASCDRNRDPICEVLKRFITSEHKSLLELGSGTGQHAAFMAPLFPNLTWTCSDIKSNHAGIKEWIKDIDNISGPLEYEIGKNDFPEGDFDIVFTANTFHIMSENKVKLFIKGCGENLKRDSLLVVYGPFNYDNSYSSQSNAEFDKWLKDRDPESGIRNFENIAKDFLVSGFQFLEDIEMPANNRTLVLKKS